MIRIILIIISCVVALIVCVITMFTKSENVNRIATIVAVISLLISVISILAYNSNSSNNENESSKESRNLVDTDNESIDIDNRPDIPTNESVNYIEDLYVVDSDRYEGNEGDSFIYKIGCHKFSKGNKDVFGNEYEHGLEMWIARWNYTEEISWAYSTFETNRQYLLLTGRVVLIESYNTENFDTMLCFYDEDRLIKEYNLTPNTIPFDIEIDIENIEQLKIYVKDNIATSGGTSFGLVNCELK